MVDLISGGRLELGLGAGYAQVGVRRVRRRHGAPLRPDRSGRAGSKAAARQRRDHTRAGAATAAASGWAIRDRRAPSAPGRAGMGLLSLDRSLVEPYRAGLVEGGGDWSARPNGRPRRDHRGRRSRSRRRSACCRTGSISRTPTARLRRKPDGSPLSPIELDRAREALQQTGRLGSLQVLDVDAAIAELRERVAGLPAEYAYAWMSLADMPDDLTERHLELWCGPVRQALETAASVQCPPTKARRTRSGCTARCPERSRSAMARSTRCWPTFATSTASPKPSSA